MSEAYPGQNQETRQSTEAVMVYPANYCHINFDMYYTRQDPLAVKFIFPPDNSGSPVEWAFARELLREGLNPSGAGKGDVRFWPIDATRLQLDLCAPSGVARLWLNYQDATEFLARTDALVPADQEEKIVEELFSQEEAQIFRD